MGTPTAINPDRAVSRFVGKAQSAMKGKTVWAQREQPFGPIKSSRPHQATYSYLRLSTLTLPLRLAGDGAQASNVGKCANTRQHLALTERLQCGDRLVELEERPFHDAQLLDRHARGALEVQVHAAARETQDKPNSYLTVGAGVAHGEARVKVLRHQAGGKVLRPVDVFTLMFVHSVSLQSMSTRRPRREILRVMHILWRQLCNLTHAPSARCQVLRYENQAAALRRTRFVVIRISQNYVIMSSTK